MPVIDSQVHVYEADTPERPWVQKITGPKHVTGEEQVAAMNALGIDGAIIVSTYMTYRFDSSYAEQVHARFPTRFALVKPVDPSDPAVAEDMAQWAAKPGAVGVRVMLAMADIADPADPGLNLVLAEGARLGMPVNLFATRCLDEAYTLISRNPDTVVVIDHLGLPQTYLREDEDVWLDLPKVLKLAELPNVRIKLTGAGTMSSQPFPFEDLWDRLLPIIDAYGTDRCMWGTDWTRALKYLNYEQAVEYFRTSPRLSDSDRAMLMGGTVEQTYGWTPASRASSISTEGNNVA
jgi:L-fuconolactonase